MSRPTSMLRMYDRVRELEKFVEKLTLGAPELQSELHRAELHREAHELLKSRASAFVWCNASCGVVPLTEQEYLAQLERPNRGWACTKCGGAADYHDTLSERAQGVS